LGIFFFVPRLARAVFVSFWCLFVCLFGAFRCAAHAGIILLSDGTYEKLTRPMRKTMIALN
jgi:hypothetical protein